MAKKKCDLKTACRTCGVNSNNKNDLCELTTRLKKLPGKTLWDLLDEIVCIEPKSGYSKHLPHRICSMCNRKLKNAYHFIVQARKANENMLKILKQASDEAGDQREASCSSPNTDCLQESPIQANENANELVEVKIEVEAETVRHKDGNEKIRQENLIQNVSDPLNEITKSELESVCSSSDEDYDDLPLATRRKSQQVIKTKQSEQHTYKCDQCEKSYLRPKNLMAHLKTHNDQIKPMRSTNLCERRKVKAVDINMCKPNGCKLIQCMICLRKYTKYIELRNHLNEHRANINFGERQESVQEIAESFYNDIKDITDEQLVNRIRKDLNAGIYARFYSITNESGYELSLESSETDSDCDMQPNQFTPDLSQSNYHCELCKANYKRKYQLFEHQLQTHNWLDAHYDCARCEARFVSKTLLVHHQETLCKNTQKRFLCNKCPQRFRWKHNYRAHNKDHRNKKQTLACCECERTYDDKKSLTIHMLTVHADKSQLLPCHWCNRKFYRKDYLLKHLIRHGLKEKDLPLAETLIAATSKPHGTKCVTCKICNVQFDRIADLRIHLLLELKSPMTLHQCYDSPFNYSITNASGYEMDIADSETEDDTTTASAKNKIDLSRMMYRCDLCQVQCRRKFEIMQHQRAMHRFETLPYVCEKCIFKSVSKDLLEHHKRTQCLNTEKKLECKKCGYKFMWPENIELHMRLQHPVEAESNSTFTKNESPSTDTSQKLSSVPAPKLLQCPHCDRTYLLQSFLNNHIRDVHVEGNRKKKEAERKFLCSLCGLEAQTSSNLVIHMRRHTGERPFKCEDCNMGFIRHSELIIHKRRHTGERPYHCTVCGKDFARSDKLKRHMLTHSGLKPYNCTFCEKTYRYSKDLKLHLLQHTGETPFECGTCGERFMQNAALEKHRMMRRHFDESK